MRRVIVAPIVGDGSLDNPFRADIPGSRMVSAAIGSILSGPQRGHPANDWALVYADVEDEATYSAGMERRGYSELLVADSLAAFDRSVESRVRQGLPVAISGDSGRAVVDTLLARQYPYADRDKWEEQAAGRRRIRGGAGGAVIVQDSFTDTNGTGLADHDPDVGGAWVATTFTVFGFSSQIAEIQSNRLQSGGSSSQTLAYRNAAIPGSAEYTLACDWLTGVSSANAERSGLFARMTPTGTSRADVDHYFAAFGYSSGTSGAAIAKVISDSQTTLTNINPIGEGLQASTQYAVAFEVLDAAKTLEIVGVLELTTADNDITQVGRVGVSAGRNSGGSYIDNFLAEEFPPPPAGAGIYAESGLEYIAAGNGPLEDGDGESELAAAMRFTTINVPQGALITEATLRFTLEAVTGSPDTTCYGADVDDLAAWADPGNLPSNAAQTTASVAFAPTGTGAMELDVTTIVQEIVNRAGWEAENAMGFVFVDEVGSGDNYWRAVGYSEGTTPTMFLDITWQPTGGV